MIIGITMLIISFIYLFLTGIMYYSKKRIKNIENKLYNFIIITTFFGIFLEIGCILLVPIMDKHSLLNEVVNRLYLVYIMTWITIFTKYVFAISFDNDKKFSIIVKNNIKKIDIGLLIIYITFVLGLIFMPLYYFYDGKYVYSYGPATNLLYIANFLVISLWAICVILNYKQVGYKKYIPLFTFIVGAFVNLFVRSVNPGILLITVTQTFITVMMYFTIENPDIRMIEQLNIARDQADRANQAKSDFLSSMSHEIRTPLNAIVGFSQALSEEDLPPQAKEEVKDVMMACDTLLDIVNGILDISKIEANKLEIVNTEYNFNLILEELVSLSKARLGEKPLDFRYSFSPDLPKYMYGDKLRVKQVILNLLTNAIKYTHEGYIDFKVNCVRKGDVCRLIISVQDSGIGIKQENIDKLFNRFERLDVEKNNTIEGTGLGLAITKKLIGLMGGQIVVQSVYGEGSKFTIALDQRIVDKPTDPNLERTQALDLSAIKNIDLTNKRILVVDDNKINLKVASRLLQDYHCIVDTLDSGIECVEKIKMGASYDLILMDDMMPKMSGTETFHKLQEIEGFNTPVISLTANAISGMREKYLAEGFSDYLSKPIDKTELNRVLNKFLG